MNKTAILSFILDEVALKCRNVSSNMRKRIHWMLKHMEITVRKYDERAIILNGWVRVWKEGVQISEVEIKKGASNYKLKTQEQLDKLITLNNEVRCDNLSFIPTAPFEVESTENLVISQDNYDIYSKCSFNTVKQLKLCGLSTGQIKFILTRCKRIDELCISCCFLEKLNLGQSRIKQFCFKYVSFREQIYLPREIEILELMNCVSPNLINAQRVNKIYFRSYTDDPKEHVELTKTLKGVKVAKIGYNLEKYLSYLPFTIRKIDRSWDNEDNSNIRINQFPYLIEVTGHFQIQPTDKNKIRVIWPKLEETQEKFNLRPRRITVDSHNTRQLNSHPELFEKVEWVWINTSTFNFDVLPSEIKRIVIWREVDLESVILNRLEKERE